MSTFSLPEERGFPPEKEPVTVARISQHGYEVRTKSDESFGGYREMMELAGQLVTTGFLPPAIKTAAQCVAIILTGKELGLGPMQSLRSIYIVQNKPALSADLQLALFKRGGGHCEFTTLTDERAVATFEHANGDKHTETFTIKDAQAAGVTGNPTWKKFPKAMLRSRCITAGLKSVGFEPTSGMYDPEELGVDPASDGAEATTVTVIEHPSKARGAQSGSTAEAHSARTNAEVPTSTAEPEPSQKPAPAPQLKRAKLRQKDVDRLLRLADKSLTRLQEAAKRALAEDIDPIDIAASWPEMSADDYHEVERQIGVDLPPEALTEDERSPETLIADAKLSVQERRKRIQDLANTKLMSAKLLNDLASVATNGAVKKFVELTDDLALHQVEQAVAKWQ